MYGCMDVWMYGCMDGWMHACMHVCMYVYDFHIPPRPRLINRFHHKSPQIPMNKHESLSLCITTMEITLKPL